MYLSVVKFKRKDGALVELKVKNNFDLLSFLSVLCNNPFLPQDTLSLLARMIPSED